MALDTTLFDKECAKRLFKALHVHWRDDDDYQGMYRPGYSMQENAAIAMVIQEASRIGMRCYADLAGNVYMVFAGKDNTAPVILTGSHLDAVPQGGQYDGPAGVIGPLAMCSAMHKAGMVPPQDIVVMIIRAEESHGLSSRPLAASWQWVISRLKK
jgi:beta-ureidopropionase / N-carbamoyl-L-amino-acid hydrolase